MAKDYSDNLQKIDHIVVLMMENHSFDNMLGWLYDDENPPKNPPANGRSFYGLTRDIWNPLDICDDNGVPFIEKVEVRKNGEPTKFRGKEIKHDVDFTLPNPDPGEGYKDTNHQLFESYDVPQRYPPEPTMRGFVNNYRNANLYSNYSYNNFTVNPRKIMISYTPDQLPVLSQLAQHYAVCDQWFSSVPSQTLCNRSFVHAATSTGNVNNNSNPLCDAETIYNRIETVARDGKKDLSWGVYGDNPLTESKRQNKPGHESNSAYFSLTRLMMTQLQDDALTGNFKTIQDFKDECANGKLPSYCFLEPTYAGPGQNDQHPPSDVRIGEQLIWDIYQAVSSSRLWEKTLLIITYDEHGGCFDHVPPPAATPPDPSKPEGEMGFLFNRMGVRVPTVLISPYIKKGTVCRPDGYVPFDHTSIIATAIRRFGLGDSLTERDRKAPDLGIALQGKGPRKDTLEIEPPPCEKKAVDTHALHDVMADVVAQLTGKLREEGEDIVEYLASNHHRAYEKK